jgi:hypothetical protein
VAHIRITRAKAQDAKADLRQPKLLTWRLGTFAGQVLPKPCRLRYLRKLFPNRTLVG